MLLRFLCIVFGYLFGLIQTSYIIGKFRGVDIRQHGSGNPGTTNSFRVFGKLFGILTLVVDIVKTVAAVFLGIYLLKLSGYYTVDTELLYTFYLGLGVVMGHDFPFFLKFKGGKGVASTAGMILAIGHWQLFGISLAVFLLIFLFTGYVSLGSILAYSIFAITFIVFGSFGAYTKEPFLTAEGYLTEIYCIAVFIAILGIYKHKANIIRLLHGNENKFNIRKKGRK